MDAGTYEVYFDDVIDTLAWIMENRDRAQDQYEESGGNPVVVHKNKGGHSNVVKNPALVMVNECNSAALTYWKELGLTAKAFQQMQKNGFQKKETSLEEVLGRIGI